MSNIEQQFDSINYDCSEEIKQHICKIINNDEDLLGIFGVLFGESVFKLRNKLIIITSKRLLIVKVGLMTVIRGIKRSDIEEIPINQLKDYELNAYYKDSKKLIIRTKFNTEYKCTIEMDQVNKINILLSKIIF
jgi:hypothetical protein